MIRNGHPPARTSTDRGGQTLLQRCSLALVLLVAGVAMQAGAADSTLNLSKYQGSYRFPDGTIITGGRMDEGGRVMLSYLDTATVRRGGIFDASDATFDGVYGTQGSIEFIDGGDVMIWRSTGEAPLRLTRIMQPESRAVAFSNGDVRLAGTLHWPPDTSGKLPAIVLAHGSGPTTRHLGPWITFFVAEGFAVLAFDKRGTGDSSGDWRSSTYLDLAADVVAAGDWLSQQEAIDATRIGLKTSSQSGWYGPHAVQQSGVFSFLIQRAAPAVNIGIGTAHEIRCELEADGIAPDRIDAAVDFWLELHRLAQDGASFTQARNALETARREEWFEPTFGDWDGVTPLWWQQHVVNMTLEPAATAARLDEPVLWFLAELDENVPYRASLDALQAAQASKNNLRIVTVHDAKHSFFVPDGNGGQRYTDEYWGVMSAWLTQRVHEPDATGAAPE